MITAHKYINGVEYLLRNNEWVPVHTYFGLSADEKPTEGVKNSEAFLEMDTGNVYLFDEDSGAWLPM